MSKVYPLVRAGGSAIAALVEFIAGEQITVGRVTGIEPICTGVALVARS